MSFQKGNLPAHTPSNPISVPRHEEQRESPPNPMPIVSPWLHRPTSVSDLFGWGNEHEAKGAKGVKGEDAYENEGTQKKPLIAKEPPLPHGDVEVVEEEVREERERDHETRQNLTIPLVTGCGRLGRKYKLSCRQEPVPLLRYHNRSVVQCDYEL